MSKNRGNVTKIFELKEMRTRDIILEEEKVHIHLSLGDILLGV